MSTPKISIDSLWQRLKDIKDNNLKPRRESHSPTSCRVTYSAPVEPTTTFRRPTFGRLSTLCHLMGQAR